MLRTNPFPISAALQLAKKCQLVAESKGFYLLLASDGDNGDQWPWLQASHRRLDFTSEAHEREETVWLEVCIKTEILVSDMGTMKSAFGTLKETER